MLLRAYGAELVLSSGADGMRGAVEKAAEIVANTPGAILAQQFANAANPAIHRATTGPEVWNDTDGAVDIFVAGIGTGGTISGAGAYLKEQKPGLTVVAVEPEESPILNGGAPGPHAIQGIGAGFIPANLHTALLDGVIQVDPADAKAWAKRAAAEEGMLVGISSGATLAAIAQKLPQLPSGSRILGFNYDTGERYLSVPDFLPEL